jgi:broad specificity phosphatase PhoE
MSALYLIRHACPAVAGVLLGQSDPPLSADGRREAARALGNLEVERIYSSPLLRATETAALLRSSSEITVLDGLAEISLGAWDGKSWTEVQSADPELAFQKSLDWFGVSPPDGEPWTAFSNRVIRALGIVRKGPTPAAIVAHLAVNSVIAAEVLGSTPVQFQQSYCEVIELDL